MTTLHLFGRLGQQRVALRASDVEAVLDIASVTPVPLAPPHLLGIAAVRSQIVTVIDTPRLVGAPVESAAGRAVVTLIEGHRYALRMTAVDDVCEASPAEGTFDRAALAPCWARIAVGRLSVGREFALLLDVASLVPAQVAEAA